MRGELRMVLRAADGALVEVREGHNAVMRSGAELVAGLFSGAGVAITHMGVGTSGEPEPETYDTATLGNEDVDGGGPLTGPTEVALAPEAFSVVTDTERRVVKVKLRATMPPGSAIGTIREAGLLARARNSATLYNRITFAPVTKLDDHELTLFWEVTFPYGDLHWLP